MIYLKVRKIGIDVIPGDPFVTLFVDKIIEDANGNIIQTIGNFDRIYHRASEVPLQLAANIADDGYVDGLELFNLVAGAAYIWIIAKHGGAMIDGKLVIEA